MRPTLMSLAAAAGLAVAGTASAHHTGTPHPAGPTLSQPDAPISRTPACTAGNCLKTEDER